MQDSMFGHLVSRFPANAENLATEALAFILERSTVAADAMIHFAQLCAPGLAGPLRFRTQDWGDDRAIPDLVGIDTGGITRLIVEAKFDAGLTEHQPTTYLARLPADDIGLLLVVAPARRHVLLWDELIRRVGDAGLIPEEERHPSEDVRSVRLSGCRTLGLASWPALLGLLGERLSVHQDPARADLAQLEGLCSRVEAEAFLPLRSEELTGELPRRLLQYLGLMRRVSDQLHAEGVLRIVSWSAGADGWWGRYVEIDDWTCLLRFSASAWATQAATPLWLQIGYQGKPRPTEALDAMAPLVAERPRRVFDRTSSGFVDVALFLTTGQAEDEVVSDVIGQVQRIAKCIREYRRAKEPRPLARQIFSGHVMDLTKDVVGHPRQAIGDPIAARSGSDTFPARGAPPTAVVVRGGLSAVETLRDNAEDTHAAEGVWGISAWVAVDADVGALLKQLGDLLPHGRIRTTTVGALQDAGFEVEETPPPGHVTIHLGGRPSDDVLRRLESLLGPPTPRPVPGRPQ